MASPKEFVFRDGVEELRLPTELWVDTQGRIEGFDNRPSGSTTLRRVAIFEPAPSDPNISRTDLLAALLRYGLSELLRKRVLKVRPVVRFAGLGLFDPVLGGFQRELFQEAARKAGARRVLFDDPPPN